MVQPYYVVIGDPELRHVLGRGPAGVAILDHGGAFEPFPLVVPGG